MSRIRRFIALLSAIVLILPAALICAHATEYSMQESTDGIITVVSDEALLSQIPSSGFAAAIPLNPVARSTDGPVYYFQSVVGSFTASCSSESWNHGKTERYPIDEIAAEVRVYEFGCYVATRRDEHRNSYTAKASYTGEALSFVVDREAYGYHYFKLTGYETMEKETYAS